MLFSDVARGQAGPGRGSQRGWRGQRARRGTAAGALAAGLAAVTLAGCGSSSSPSPSSSATGASSLSGQTLIVYTQAPYGTQLNQYKEYYSYIANAFHKATGSTIDWVYSASAVSLSQELEQATATGSGPDVWSIGSSFNGTATALHEFYPIPPSDWTKFGGQSDVRAEDAHDVRARR